MRRVVAVCSILMLLSALGGFIQGYAEGNEENLSLGRGFGVGMELNTPFWEVPTGFFLEFWILACRVAAAFASGASSITALWMRTVKTPFRS